MARAMWKGVISFGLVNIPVQLFSAISEQRVSFHMLSPDGECRLRRKLYCPETGKEYDFSETARGYEIAPDQYVIIDKEEIDNVKPDADRSINILDFVDLESIDPLYYNRSYYLAPDKGGAKSYQLLVQAMEETSRVAIAKFVMRGHEYLAAVRVLDDNVLGLETMYFAEDVRPADDLDLPKDVKVQKKEVTLAKQLVETLYTEFDPGKYENEYRDALRQLVEQKAEGKEIVVQQPPAAEPTNVVDLMSVLKKSLEDRKSERKKTARKGKREAA